MPLSRENKIKIISLIILTGFILAAVFACYQRYFLGRGYPYSTFLFRPGDRFNDFYNWVNNSKNLNPYLATDPNPARNVSPFLYLSGYLLTVVDRQAAFILLTIIFAGLFVHINIKNLKMEKTPLFLRVFVVFIFSFLSYPFIFLVDRGNVDGLIFIILYFFLHYYKKKQAIISSILLTIAIAWKIVPAVFIVLFIADKRYKEGIISIVAAIILTIFSLSIFQGGMINNTVRWLNNLDLYNKIYAIGNGGLFFGHSLFGLIKIVMSYFYLNDFKIIQQVSSFYLKATAVVFLAITVYIVKFEKELWKIITLFIISICLFPLVSADYKLILFFLPLFLFINHKKHDKYDLIYCLLFALLLIPKNYYNFKLLTFDFGITAEANLGVVANPIIMLLMMILIILSNKNIIKTSIKSVNN